MKILVACEESQAVTIELRKRGHDAFSCDILPCSGGHPEWHIQGDARPELKKKWDMVLSFPPCTDLAASGARYFEQKKKDGRQQKSIHFFMDCIKANAPRVMVENPVGIMSSHYRKPDQIIQPWQFGHPESKSTCLWLKGLPLLKPTNILSQPVAWVKCEDCEDYFCTIHKVHVADCTCPGIEEWITKKKKDPYLEGGYWSNQTPSGQNKLGPSPERSKLRSKTYKGIAAAMAKQWTK